MLPIYGIEAMARGTGLSSGDDRIRTGDPLRAKQVLYH